MQMPDGRKVCFALLGCGSIVRKHMHALHQIADAEIVAVCDVVPEAAKRAGEQFGVSYYTDPRQMLERHHVDVISVLTPSGSHAQNILDLVQYGRDFLVEKPLCLRLEDADKIIAACDRSGSKVFVVQQNRFNRPIVKLKQALDQQRFGRLHLVTARVRWCRRQSYYEANPWRGTWALDGGVITNQASHHIDMLSWLGGPVESIVSMTTTLAANIEAEDTGIALVRFVHGGLGIIEATTATRPTDLEGSISVLGEKGSVVVGGFYMNELTTWQFEESSDEDDEVWAHWRINPDERAWNHGEYLRHVISCIKEGHSGLVDGLEARKSLELISAIYESAETGREVFLRFKPRVCRLGAT